MENHRNRKSPQLAPPTPPFRVYGSPSQFRRESAEARRSQSRPVIDINLISGDLQAAQTSKSQSSRPRIHGQPVPGFAPGDFLICEYTIDVPAALNVHSFEASVVWFTTGKGDSDIGVHFFERRLTRSLPDGYLKQVQRLSTVLPLTPLSYTGRIVQIKWGVRIRLFLDDNSQFTQDAPFRLGNAAPCEIGDDAMPETNDAADDDAVEELD